MEPSAAAPSAEFLALADSFEFSLEARNRARATVFIYLDAVHRFGRFLAERDLPAEVRAIRREHVEAFIADLLKTHSPSTALNRFKSLQQFFRFLADEEEIDASPMARMSAPSVPESEVPVPTSDDLRALLKACEGRSSRSGGTRRS